MNASQQQIQHLSVTAVTVSYQQSVAVQSLSLALEEGEIGCLLGPSGCGKTSLLRAIAGFEEVHDGAITLAGKTLSSKHLSTAPEKRSVGMVFQDFALFPHLSVSDNIGFGLRHLNRAETKARITELLQLVKLQHLAKKYPHELSGGQQQRIALIRALAPKPSLLLLDEPFSSMDTDLRQSLAKEVRHILKQQKTTAVLVTHDQNEAFIMADKIGVMQEGELVQWGTAYQLYHKPATNFVAHFIGTGTLIDGSVTPENTIKTALGTFDCELPRGSEPGTEVQVLIRPDDILHDDDSPFTATITGRQFRGADFLYNLDLNGTPVVSLVNSHHEHAIGEELGIEIELDHLVVFHKQA